MSVNENFSRVFLVKNPQESARLLESIDAHHVAQVFDKTPPEIAAPVVQKMLSIRAAGCLEQLSPAATAGILDRLPAQTAAAIMRQLSAADRERVLRDVGNAHSMALRFLLRYPSDVIGAWMDPAAFTIAVDSNVEESRRQYDKAYHPHHKIIVLDRDRRVRGAVDVRLLFRTDKRRTLTSLLESIETLRARETLPGAQASDVWDRESQVPVLNRQGEFVGVITYADIRKGQRLGQGAGGRPRQEHNDVAELLLIGMESVWDGMEQLLVDKTAGSGRSLK
jgi:Mg/Co/Ni transporter MgtE